MALLAGTTGAATGIRGSVCTEVALSYPLRDATATAGDGAAAFSLPRPNIPVLLDLPVSLAFNPSPADLKAMVDAMSDRIESWLNTQGVTSQAWPGLYGRATLEFAVAVFSNLSETGIPIITLRGPYVNLSVVKLPAGS